MYQKEPVYALDHLKRTYYIMMAVIYDLDVLMKDLEQEISVKERTQLRWRKKAQKGRKFVHKHYLVPLRQTAAREIKTVEALCEKAGKIQTAIEKYISPKLLSVLEKKTQDDYRFYTSCGYGKYWNEVDLPEIVDILFERFCELVKADNRGMYAVSVYDMSDREIPFTEEQQVNALMELYDLEPCEKLFKSQGVWHCY